MAHSTLPYFTRTNDYVKWGHFIFRKEGGWDSRVDFFQSLFVFHNKWQQFFSTRGIVIPPENWKITQHDNEDGTVQIEYFAHPDTIETIMTPPIPLGILYTNVRTWCAEENIPPIMNPNFAKQTVDIMKTIDPEEYFKTSILSASKRQPH